MASIISELPRLWLDLSKPRAGGVETDTGSSRRGTQSRRSRGKRSRHGALRNNLRSSLSRSSRPQYLRSRRQTQEHSEFRAIGSKVQPLENHRNG